MAAARWRTRCTAILLPACAAVLLSNPAAAESALELSGERHELADTTGATLAMGEAQAYLYEAQDRLAADPAMVPVFFPSRTLAC